VISEVLEKQMKTASGVYITKEMLAGVADIAFPDKKHAPC
jgi:hypothetical protein